MVVVDDVGTLLGDQLIARRLDAAGVIRRATLEHRRGAGTPADGALVYAQKCQVCHGDKGVGGPNDRLVGGQGTLASKTPVRTIGSYWPYATTVFDYVRRSMPFFQPHSLTDSEVYAVTAYLLSLNGIIGEQDVMNAETLPKVKMPNRDNFILVQPWKPRAQ